MEVTYWGRLRLTFCYSNEDKFSHYFNDTLDPIVRCGREPETLSHYLLRGNLYPAEKLEVLNKVCDLNPPLKVYSNEKFLNILLHKFEEFNCNMSRNILKATITFLKTLEHFNGLLL